MNRLDRTQRKWTMATMLAGLLFFPVLLNAADPTLEEFKKAISKRLPKLSDKQLDKFVKLIDQDKNGTLSQSELSDRITVTQALQSVQREQEAQADKPRGPVVNVPKISKSPQAAVLLVTADEIAKAWIPFAKWKTQLGKPTKIVTVGQILKDYKADNIHEQIRLCVRDHIENHGTQWVILGGDSLRNGRGLVPGGHTTVHAQEPAGIPTDIVYLSKTNWDADGDGLHGEFKDDRKAVTYPDGSVGLGRIPVRTAEDVAAFTEKVIAYESNYPTDDFAKQMIYTCTDSPGYPKVRNSWDGYVSKVWDGEVGRFFSEETPWDKEGKPGSHALSTENLISLINGKTVGKLHIHGHGILPCWILEDSKFTVDDVAQLTNRGAYPLMTTVSCFTGEYDSPQDPSIVERMLRKAGGGSVAVVAPVRTGKPHFHSRSDFRLMVTKGKLDGTTQTMTRYWSNGLGSGLTTGQALMKAKGAMAADAEKTAGYHLCICELNLLGDPTLDMRANRARAAKLEVPATIATGKQTVEITTDIPDSTVCLWKGEDVYALATTDQAGRAKVKIESATKGDLLVTVYGPSLNAVTKTITVK